MGMSSQGQMALRRRAFWPLAETWWVVIGVQFTCAPLLQQCFLDGLANPARTVA